MEPEGKRLNCLSRVKENCLYKRVHTSETSCSTNNLLCLGDVSVQHLSMTSVWEKKTLSGSKLFKPSLLTNMLLKIRKNMGDKLFPPDVSKLCTVTEVKPNKPIPHPPKQKIQTQNESFKSWASLLQHKFPVSVRLAIYIINSKIWKTKALSVRPCLGSVESWKRSRKKIPEHPQACSGCLLNGSQVTVLYRKIGPLVKSVTNLLLLM